MMRLTLTWLRLLILVLSLPLASVAMDVIASDPSSMEVDGCCSDCPLERGKECPADCPSCHCHHAGVAAAIPEPMSEEILVTGHAHDVVQTRPVGTRTPRQPVLETLFRPPRTALAT